MAYLTLFLPGTHPTLTTPYVFQVLATARPPCSPSFCSLVLWHFACAWISFLTFVICACGPPCPATVTPWRTELTLYPSTQHRVRHRDPHPCLGVAPGVTPVSVPTATLGPCELGWAINLSRPLLLRLQNGNNNTNPLCRVAMGIRTWRLCTMSWVRLEDSFRSRCSTEREGRPDPGQLTHALQGPKGEGTGLVGAGFPKSWGT